MAIAVLTAEQQKRATDKLIQWIEIDKRIVTYREVAREIRCDINSAKNILKSHMTSHPSLFPTYLLTGTLSTSSTSDAMDVDPSTDTKPTDDAEGDADIGMQEELRMTQPEITSLRVLSKVREEKVPRRGVWLVGGDKLEEKRTAFEKEGLTTQIYSLSPARISDPAQYLNSTTRLRSYPKYYDSKTYGTLTGDFELATTEKRGESSKSAFKSAAITKSAETKPSSVKETKENKPGQSVKSMFAASASTKSATAKGKEKASEGGLQSGGKKAGKRVVHSEDEEEEEEEEEEVKVPPRTAKSTKPAAKTTAKPPPPQIDAAEEERLAMEAMIAMSDDIGKSSDPLGGDVMDVDVKPRIQTVPAKRQSTSGKAEASAGKDETTPKAGRIRKKRRVVRQVATTDAKGYMVMDDVSSVESYSSDESSAPAPPAKAKKSTKAAETAATKSKAGASSAPPKKAPPKKAGQQSLFGYMKKK